MIGAIIGDIAAWTYEHDREAFWNQLISYDDKVSLSEFGRAYMQAASWNLSALSNRETYTLDITDYSPTDLLSVTGQWLMWQLMSAWNDNLDYPKGLNYAPYTDKEEFYARLFVVDIIRGLRQGKTKSEVFHSVESLKVLLNLGNVKGSLLMEFLPIKYLMVFSYMYFVHGIPFIGDLILLHPFITL